MDSNEYQVTIKSANQKVDDYSTTCYSNWTVLQLKQRISETHENRPNVEDQKLIYAGNLLSDTHTLKQIFFRDSFCTELNNSSKTDFTIHLVCYTHAVRHVTNSGTASQKPTSSQVSTQANTSTRASTNRGHSSIVVNSRINDSNVPSSMSLNNNSPTTAQSNVPPTTQHLPTQSETIRNIMQSDQMRQQAAIFQQLACIVAEQIARSVSAGIRPFPSTLNSDVQSNQAPSFITPSSAPTLSVRITASHIGSQVDSVPHILYSSSRQQPQLAPPSSNGLGGHQGDNIGRDNNRAPEPARFDFEAQAEPAPAEQVAPQPNQNAPMHHDFIDLLYFLVRAIIFMAALYIHATMFRLLIIVGVLAVAYFFNRRSARRASMARRGPPAQHDHPGHHQVVQDDIGQRGANQNDRLQPVVDSDNNVNLNNDQSTGTQQGRIQADTGAHGRLTFLKLCYLVITEFLASLVPE